MAILKSNEVAALDAPSRVLLQENVSNSRLFFFEATYVAKGTEQTSGDSIAIGDLPVGAIVLPEFCRIANEASMGGGTLAITKIGDAVDDDRISATSFSVNSSTAGQSLITPNIADGIITRTPITEATKRLYATFTCATAPTAGKKIKFIIAFRPRG